MAGRQVAPAGFSRGERPRVPLVGLVHVIPAEFVLIADEETGVNKYPNVHIYQGDAPHTHCYCIEFPVLIGSVSDYTLQFELWLEAAGPRIQYTLLEVM